MLVISQLCELLGRFSDGLFKVAHLAALPLPWPQRLASVSRSQETEAVAGRSLEKPVSTPQSDSLFVDGRARVQLSGGSINGVCALVLFVCDVAMFAPQAEAQSSGTENRKSIEARITFDADAEVVALPVSINGKNRQFVVDTGATVSVFDSSLRAELAAPLRTVPVETSGGSVQVELFRAPAAKLGDRVLSGVSEVLCTDLSHLRAASGVDFSGIIGMDFLQHRVIRIDFDRGEFLWLRGVPDVAGESFALRWCPQGREVLLTVVGEGAVPFVVDTGCTFEGVVDSKVMSHLIEHGFALPVVTEPVESARGSRDRRGAVLREISLNGFRHHGALFFEGTGNLLGLGYLARYVVTIDFPNKKMYLKPGARFNELSRWNLSGLHATRLNGLTPIETVTPGSLAEKAGLKPGDEIEQIDGRSTSSITLAQLDRALSLEGRHSLRVSRGGKTREVVLDLKEPPEIRAIREDRPERVAPGK